MNKRVGMFLLALVAGYVAMVVLIFVVQDGMFGGITYQETPLPQLLVAGILTSASAAVGGMVAAWIFGKPFFPPAWAMCGLVVLESTYMIGSGRMPGPVWFDVMAASGLLVGILLGAYAIQRWKPVASPSASLS